MTMNGFPSDAVSFHQFLGKLLGSERDVQVEFLIALAEFDRQELYLLLGYASLWEFCMKELQLCKGSTYKRTHAAALISRFPHHRCGSRWLVEFDHIDPHGPSTPENIRL